MARLADKIQNALDEARTMILGVQVLIGFSFRAPIEQAYGHLSSSAKGAATGTTLLLLITFVVLLLPSTTHRLTEQGADTPRLHRLTTLYVAIGLALFALAVAGSLYSPLSLAGPLSSGAPLSSVGWAPLAAGCAAVIFVFCLVLWFGLGLRDRWRRSPGARQATAHGPRDAHECDGHERDGREQEKPAAKKSEQAMAQKPGTEVTEKIKHVLTEARVILPGAQALLGFSLAAVFTSKFADLGSVQQAVHLAGTLLDTIAVALLILPAAYHRLAERGEETEAFHRFAGRVVLLALAPLITAMGCELFVILSMNASGALIPLAVAAAMTALMLALLFGLPLLLRGRAGHQRTP